MRRFWRPFLFTGNCETVYCDMTDTNTVRLDSNEEGGEEKSSEGERDSMTKRLDAFQPHRTLTCEGQMVEKRAKEAMMQAETMKKRTRKKKKKRKRSLRTSSQSSKRVSTLVHAVYMRILRMW